MTDQSKNSSGKGKQKRRGIGAGILEMFRTALKPPTTERYPFGPPQVADRFRGKIDIDPVKCTGCGICEIVCPASIITMVNLGKRKVGEREIPVKRPVFDLYGCISCGQCVEDCRFGALILTKEFELAVKNKDLLVLKKALENVQ